MQRVLIAFVIGLAIGCMLIGRVDYLLLPAGVVVPLIGVFMGLMLLLVFVMFFLYRRRYVVAFSFSAFLFFLFLICNLFAYQQYRNIVSTKCGIVIAESVNVKSSPSKNSMDLFEIHSGTRLTILDNSMKEWIEIRYEDEKEGWIEKETIELI